MPKIALQVALRCVSGLVPAAAVALAMSPNASAAEGASASDVEAPAEQETGTTPAGQIGDIIVTAQRQSESSQRAAVAISVLQPEALKAVTSVENLSKLAPAVQFSAGSGTLPLLYVRGVGTFAVNPYTDSAIAVNYDGIYLGRPSSVSGLFYDLQRIEVLKGPQGTLYGRNATGGALNIIPATPVLGERSMAGSVSVGNYDSVKAEAAINLPVSDKLAFRLAGTTYAHDGYNSDGTYTEKGTGARAQLLFEPSDTVSIRLAGDYFDLGGTGNVGTIVAAYSPFTGVRPTGLGPEVGPYDPRTAAFLNTVFVPSAGRTLTALAARPYIDNQYYGLNTEINADLGFGALTVVGAWRRADQDLVSSVEAFLLGTKETDEQYSLEVRLAGKAGSLDWLVGGFYFDEKVKSLYTANFAVLGSVQNLEASNRSYAGFGRLTLHLADTLRLTGAARYTHDRKTFDGVATTLFGACTAATHLCPNGALLPGNIDNIPAAFASIGYVPFGPAAYGDPTGASQLVYLVSPLAVDAKISPSKVTYRAAAEFEPRAGSMLYASLETGYRSGGFSFSTLNPTYDPETITAYTIGSKNRFLDNRLQLNVEGFIWKYKDQQIAHQIVTSTGSTEFITENIGASTIKGVEVEMVAKPLVNTLLRADIQYLDAKNKNFVFLDVDNSALAGLPAGSVPPSTNCPSTPNGDGTYTVDCSGLRPLRAPKWSINFGAQQTIPLESGHKFLIEVNTHYQTSSLVMFERQPLSTSDAYWLTDAAITFALPDDRMNIGVFVNNIEDKRMKINAAYSGLTGTIGANYGVPRTYGARLGFKF